MSEIIKDFVWVRKGWGGELWLVNNELYCGKFLYIHQGRKLSLHRHELKSEHFYIEDGTVELTYYDNPDLDALVLDWDNFYANMPNSTEKPIKVVLEMGNVFPVPIGRRHTLRALKEAKVIEISTTHKDEDSIRILKGD